MKLTNLQTNDWLQATKPKAKNNLRSSLVNELLGDDAASQVLISSNRVMAKAHAGLATRRQQLTKIAVGILDGHNAIKGSFDGFKAIKDDVVALEKLAVEAQKPDLTEAQRKKVQDDAAIILNKINAEIDTKKFNGQHLLTGEVKKFQISLSEKRRDVLPVDLPIATRKSLGIDNLDFSTPAAAIQSLTSLGKAKEQLTKEMNSLEKLSNKLATAGESLGKKLSTLLSTEEALGINSASSLAQSFDPKAMLKAQKGNTALYSRINSLLD